MYSYDQKQNKQITIFQQFNSVETVPDLQQILFKLNFDKTLTSRIDDKTNNTLLHQWAPSKGIHILRRAFAHEEQQVQRLLEDLTYERQKLTEEEKSQILQNGRVRLEEWVNRKNAGGMTALQIANNAGNHQFYQHLVENGGRADIMTSEEETEIHISAQGNQLSNLLRSIIRISSSEQYFQQQTSIEEHLKKITVSGQTPLHVAAQSGSPDCCELIIQEYRQGINQQDKNGNTPLHLACLFGRLQTVEKLLVYGADTSIRNFSEPPETPFDIAVQNEFQEIIETLSAKTGFSDYLKVTLYGKSKPRRLKGNYWPLIIGATAYFVVFISNYLMIQPPSLNLRGMILLPSIYYTITTIVYLSLIFTPKYSWSACNYPQLVDEKNFCIPCKIPKMSRSKHCYVCNTCTLQFDHHNYWINNCVGKKNRGKFLLFVYLLLISSVKSFLFSLCGLFIAEWKSPIQVLNHTHAHLRKLIIFIDLGFIIFSMLILIHLAYIHTCNFFLNRTSEERFGRYGKLPFQSKQIKNEDDEMIEEIQERESYQLRNCKVMCH